MLNRLLCALLVVVPATTTAQASDSAAVVVAVQRLFDAMAARDTASARVLLVPGTSFVSMRPSPAATPRRQADTAFLRSLASGKEKLLERMWSPIVRVHGAVAEVTAPYDFHIDGRFSHCGTDVFTLLKTAQGWRIAGIVYTVETTGCKPHPAGPPG